MAISGRERTEEPLGLGSLPRLWDGLETVYNRVTALPDPDVTALTSRRFDEAQTAGHRGYFTAARYLGVAMDNHEALMALLTKHGAGFAAPFSLLRPMFESGFFACWVLDPTDGLERRKRGLRCEVNDERERTAFHEVLTALPDVGNLVRDDIQERDRTVGKTFRDEAAAIGLPWDKARQRVNVSQELPKLRFLISQDVMVRTMFLAQWRLLSGMEHGLAYAMMRSSDVSAQVVIPGGQQVRLTVNDDMLGNAYRVCIWLVIEALGRFERLHTRAD